MTKRKYNWIAATAWAPLHSQSWHQLRDTVVFDPERRTEAWRFMTLLSWTAQGRAHHEGKLVDTGERNRGN